MLMHTYAVTASETHMSILPEMHHQIAHSVLPVSFAHCREVVLAYPVVLRAIQLWLTTASAVQLQEANLWQIVPFALYAVESGAFLASQTHQHRETAQSHFCL